MKNVVSLSIGLTFSAFLFQACENADSADELNETIEQQKLQVKFVGMDTAAIPLSRQGKEYLEFLKKLSDDIVEDSTVAVEFSQNPNAYCKKAGFDNLFINMDSGLLKLILALGDQELCDAANRNDIQEFVLLCQQKGLLDINAFKVDPYVLEILDFYQRRGGIGNLGLGNGTSVYKPSGPPPSASAVYGALAIVIAAIAVEAFCIVGTTMWMTHVNGQHSSDGFPVVQQFWNLKNCNTVPSNQKLLDTIVNEGLNVIRVNFPKEYAKADKEVLKEVLMLHVLKME